MNDIQNTHIDFYQSGQALELPKLILQISVIDLEHVILYSKSTRVYTLVYRQTFIYACMIFTCSLSLPSNQSSYRQIVGYGMLMMKGGHGQTNQLHYFLELIPKV